MLSFAYRGNRLFAIYKIGDEPKEIVADVTYSTRSTILSFAEAERIAAEATALMKRSPKDEGGVYLATNSGYGVYPRYDVIAAPRVGAKVSYSFNGDTYPAGKIVKVSKSFRRVETDDGTVFYRRRQTGSWVSGGTWFMVSGWRDERNPSF